eukprot:168260-Rhodomonas_salina.7
MAAAMKGHIECIKILAQYGANLAHRPADGEFQVLELTLFPLAHALFSLASFCSSLARSLILTLSVALSRTHSHRCSLAGSGCFGVGARERAHLRGPVPDDRTITALRHPPLVLSLDVCCSIPDTAWRWYVKTGHGMARAWADTARRCRNTGRCRSTGLRIALL